MIVQQNWKQLSSIQVGGVICLPVIVIGQTLGREYGLYSSLIAIALGNLFLLALAIITAIMSHQEKKTTAENTSALFGRGGGIFFAYVMLLSLLGWFGIQLNLMTLALLDLTYWSSPCAFLMSNILIGSVMTLGGLYGIKGLNLLSDLSIPLLLMTLLYALFTPQEETVTSSLHSLEWGGISMVIATAIAAVIDLPTYFRHASTKKDAVIAVIAIFGLAIPLIEGVGVYLGVTRGGESVIHLLKGTHPLWNLWIGLFILLAGWTTNNANLYSGVISLEFIWPKATFLVRTLTVGGVGTFLGCCDLLNHLELVLDLLGIGISSMGALMIFYYLFNAREHKQALFFVWGVGVLLGLTSLMKVISICSIPILDAFFGALGGSFILFLKQRKSYVCINNK